MRRAITIGAIAVVAALAFSLWPRSDHMNHNGADKGPLAAVDLPAELSQNAQIGKEMFEANCTACHGDNAAGREDIGPPLVHIIYEPNHHSDESFQRAAAMGVRRHHWPFADMPAVDGLSREDVSMIITYIRELQRANGIE